MSSQTVKTSMQRGIDYLARHQHKNGSFTIICSNPNHTDIPLTIDLDIHALILDSLLAAKNLRTKRIINRLVDYLQQRVSSLAKTKFQEVDSYALFYSLSVLYEHSPTVLSADILALAVHTLVANEQAPGGPYYNALDSHSSAPDWLTNVSISRFIHHLGGPFPKLTAYINTMPSSYNRYYTDAWPLYFFDVAHTRSSNSVSQLPDGSWPVIYIHKDPSGMPTLLYGSTSLSAVMAIINLMSLTSATSTVATSQDYYSRLAPAVYADAGTLDPLIGHTLQTKLAKLIRADTVCEIGPLAERFAHALQLPHKPSHKVLQTLGLANLYNWVAYTIYDDFLDDEGDPQLLSVANVALRKAVSLFTKAVPSAAFAKLVTQTFDTIDTANAWELANCRFAVHKDTIQIGAIPNYANLHTLHDRSLSHSLPIIGTLIAAKVLDISTIAKVQTALKHYLVVRQLNDDLCDWKDDLRAGHISYVVAQILRDASIRPGKQQLGPLTASLERTFWQQSLPHIDAAIKSHAEQVQRLLAESNIVAPDNIIAQFTSNLADAANRMQAEQQQTGRFLQAFQAQL